MPNNVAHTAKGKEPATVLVGFVMKVVITDWAGDNVEQALVFCFYDRVNLEIWSKKKSSPGYELGRYVIKCSEKPF